jgi:hypothetical protein
MSKPLAASRSPSPDRSSRGKWFRQGGWILIPAILVTALTAFYQIRLIDRARVAPRLGDGVHVESYGFDLASCTVPREFLAGSGLPKDGLARLDFPTVVPAAEAAAVKMASSHGKYLVSSDRVVGVAVGGIARAYPLRVLTWHEVVNDTLGGLAIAVTYSPNGDVASVFDRRTRGGEVLDLAFSGLVYNANLVLYDRRPSPAEESLWVQLLAAAIAGPRSGDTLAIVPFTVEHWGAWKERHPHTTVVRPDRAHVDQYGSEPYGNYYGNDVPPTFPMQAALSPDRTNKALVLGVLVGNERWVLPFSALSAMGTSGEIVRPIGGIPMKIVWRDGPPTMRLEALASDPALRAVVAVPAFQFAWHAMFPADSILAF